jgi:proline dehydrogenase
MVDAEQTYIQYAIDSVTKQLQRIHNGQKVVVMNTYQGYLKRTKRNVMLDVQVCKMIGQPFAAKIVRGAYISEEGKLALEKELDSPVFPNKVLVDKSYNDCMLYVLNNLPPRSYFTIASHNDETVELGLAAVKELQKKLEEDKCQVSFAQLKGIGDNITYLLAQKGFHTFKYLPYGPTNNLIPYLFRRAEEASYIWLEGRKKLADVKKEMFAVRKLHLKGGGIMGGFLIFLLAVL